MIHTSEKTDKHIFIACKLHVLQETSTTYEHSLRVCRRVAVEAALPSELPQLVEGLRLLNRADPFLEVTLQDKGEYVLGAAGMSCPQWPERLGRWVS